MSTLDIRNETTESVNTIIVGDCHTELYSVDTLNNVEGDTRICLSHSESSEDLVITSEQHARDIIKGIEKAIGLGWFNDGK
jgi:hypothetical protein